MPQQPATARSLVLIVEDEPLLRLYAIDIVEDAGYSTLEAPNADEAIKILTSRPDIRIVFTDINMPGSIDGLKLSHFIRDRWPPIHLIITSGNKKPAPHEMPARGAFLGKPFEPHHLVDALSALTA